MDLYEITIEPESAFGSPLMGDTLFGHFCWQVAHDPELLDDGLEPWVECYAERPAVIFSSAYPRFAGEQYRYAFRRPNCPAPWQAAPGSMEEKRKLLEERKQDQQKSWLWVDADLHVKPAVDRMANDRELCDRYLGDHYDRRNRPRPSLNSNLFCTGFNQMHNTINRLSGTTGEGAFAPFEEAAFCYHPGVNLAVFVLVEPAATDIERVAEALRRIGQWGYGKNASTGLGRFRVRQWSECPAPPTGAANGCYTLGPCVPAKGQFKVFYYSPFVRFGKHGDRWAHAENPFKNPVLMAAEGAVGIPATPDVFEKPYVGRAVLGTSKALKATIVQGYSIYLPIALESGHEETC